MKVTLDVPSEATALEVTLLNWGSSWTPRKEKWSASIHGYTGWGMQPWAALADLFRWILIPGAAQAFDQWARWQLPGLGHEPAVVTVDRNRESRPKEQA